MSIATNEQGGLLRSEVMRLGVEVDDDIRLILSGEAIEETAGLHVAQHRHRAEYVECGSGNKPIPTYPRRHSCSEGMWCNEAYMLSPRWAGVDLFFL